MWTINDLIKSGMEFFTAKTVPKADLDKVISDRDSEKSRADKAASDLAAMTKEHDELKSQLAARTAELETRNSELETARNAKGEADSKAVAEAAAKKAAAIAASAGQPPLPKATDEAQQNTVEALATAMKAETDPVKRGELFTKWKAATKAL